MNSPFGFVGPRFNNGVPIVPHSDIVNAAHSKERLL
jgi:hypothetical protein